MAPNSTRSLFAKAKSWAVVQRASGNPIEEVLTSKVWGERRMIEYRRKMHEELKPWNISMGIRNAKKTRNPDAG